MDLVLDLVLDLFRDKDPSLDEDRVLGLVSLGISARSLAVLPPLAITVASVVGICAAAELGWEPESVPSVRDLLDLGSDPQAVSHPVSDVAAVFAPSLFSPPVVDAPPPHPAVGVSGGTVLPAIAGLAFGSSSQYHLLCSDFVVVVALVPIAVWTGLVRCIMLGAFSADIAPVSLDAAARSATESNPDRSKSAKSDPRLAPPRSNSSASNSAATFAAAASASTTSACPPLELASPAVNSAARKSSATSIASNVGDFLVLRVGRFVVLQDGSTGVEAMLGAVLALVFVAAVVVVVAAVAVLVAMVASTVTTGVPSTGFRSGFRLRLRDTDQFPTSSWVGISRQASYGSWEYFCIHLRYFFTSVSS